MNLKSCVDLTLGSSKNININFKKLRMYVVIFREIFKRIVDDNLINKLREKEG